MAHTGEYIAERISFMLESWNIPQECVHLVISDNASDMVKAMKGIFSTLWLLRSLSTARF